MTPGLADPDRLRRMLGSPDTAWLLDRVRRRLAAGQRLTGTVSLTSATPEQRRAAARLLGRRAGGGASLSVSLDELDALLRRSGAAPGGLDDVVELLVGAVPDRGALAAAWAEALAPLGPLVSARPELAPWRDWLDALGMVRRLGSEPAQALALVSTVIRVLDLLPDPGGIALGTLAARATGHAHGLDDGEPVATLVLAAARVLAGAPPTGDSSAAGRRRAWAAVGVHRDELSSTVLCLGLPGLPGSPTGQTLTLARDAGEPCVLTLRQLGRDEVDLGVGSGLVRVCENPIVVASAADDLGSACPPLVCVAGQPSTAAWRLLDLLVAQGATIAYHGDFDWGGLRIGNALRERIPWRPWRFDTETYESLNVVGGPLVGRAVDATWDERLRPALERRGTKVEEEIVLADLLADLRMAGPTERPPIDEQLETIDLPVPPVLTDVSPALIEPMGSEHVWLGREHHR
jgi:uncharacterized protein (TIGR02679 family)